SVDGLPLILNVASENVKKRLDDNLDHRLQPWVLALAFSPDRKGCPYKLTGFVRRPNTWCEKNPSSGWLKMVWFQTHRNTARKWAPFVGRKLGPSGWTLRSSTFAASAALDRERFFAGIPLYQHLTLS